MSVEEVAERLNLHVRTIRAYVRQGRLKAVRIGRQYRIAPEDLEAFTGQPISVQSPERRNRGRDIEVTSIVQIETIKPDEADRLNEMLVRAANGWHTGYRPLRVQMIYEPERGRMRTVLAGDLDGIGDLLSLIKVMAGSAG